MLSSFHLHLSSYQLLQVNRCFSAVVIWCVKYVPIAQYVLLLLDMTWQDWWWWYSSVSRHISLYIQVYGVTLDLRPFAWIRFVVQWFSLPEPALAVARECTVKRVLKGSSSSNQCSAVLNTAWLDRVQRSKCLTTWNAPSGFNATKQKTDNTVGQKSI